MSSDKEHARGKSPQGAEIRLILERVKQVSGVSTDQGLAEALGGTRRQVTSWKERGNVPWDLLAEFAARHDCSLDWLIYGRGAGQVAEGEAAYTVPSVQTLTDAFGLIDDSELLRGLFERAGALEKAKALNAIARLVQATDGELNADLIAQITELGRPTEPPKRD